MNDDMALLYLVAVVLIVIGIIVIIDAIRRSLKCTELVYAECIRYNRERGRVHNPKMHYHEEWGPNMRKNIYSIRNYSDISYRYNGREYSYTTTKKLPEGERIPIYINPDYPYDIKNFSAAFVGVIPILLGMVVFGVVYYGVL